MPERKIISIKNLVLDQKNPRIVECRTQYECMLALYKSGEHSYKKLLKSIIENGFFCGENILVRPDRDRRGKYIVAEGNRRISALKFLHGEKNWHNKKDIPKELLGFLKKFPARFKDDSRQVYCVIFREDEGEALWAEIASRHMSNMAGRDDWPSVKKARERRDREGVNTPGLELLERYFDSHQGTEREWSPNFNLTVLEDFMRSLAEFLGYPDGMTMARAYRDESNCAIIDQLIEDIYYKPEKAEINVLSHRRENAQSYLGKRFSKPLLPPSFTPKNREPKETEKQGPSDHQEPERTKRKPVPKDPLQGIIEELMSLSNGLGDGSVKLFDGLKEYKTLMHGKVTHPIATSMLLRGILDYSLRIACKKINGSVCDRAKIQSMLNTVKPLIQDPELQAIVEKAQNGILKELHTFMHSSLYAPSASGLRGISTSVLAIIKCSMQLVQE